MSLDLLASDEPANVPGAEKSASENPLVFGEKLHFECQRCSSDDYRDDIMAHGAHYAKRVCNHCGAFVGWCRKPDTERSRRKAGHRTAELVAALDAVGRWYCEICTRRAGELVGTETLAAHHVEEYQDGGSPEAENLRCYCSTCHKYVHQRRTEAGWYRKAFEDLTEHAA